MINFQLSLSTADEEVNYFTGEQIPDQPLDVETLIPAGTYRVLNDQLYQIVDGMPPDFSE